jgi:sugar phosphate isomerase/epimerase
MRLSLAIQTPEVPTTIPVALLSGGLEEKLAKAAKWGAQGVELMPSDPARLNPAALRSSLTQHGLTAAAVGSGAASLAAGLHLLDNDPDVPARAADRLDDLIHFAAAVGAACVTIGSFRGRVSGSGPTGPRRLAEVLHRAAETAAASGVRLALEPLNRYECDFVHTAEEGLAFVRQVDHPAMGLLLDTYHVNIEERSWHAPFRLLMEAGVLWHVHLGDNNRLPPGQGMIDFAVIVATLRHLGYHGWLSAELLAQPDPDTAARQTLDAMRPLLEH